MNAFCPVICHVLDEDEPHSYGSLETALNAIRTNATEVWKLEVAVRRLEPTPEAFLLELLDHVQDTVQELTLNVLPSAAMGRQCPVFALAPDRFPKLMHLSLDGFYPLGLDRAFSNIRILELSSNFNGGTRFPLDHFLEAMGTWTALQELRLHNFMRVFTDEPPPNHFRLPVALPLALTNIVVEDTPQEIYHFLAHLHLPSYINLHIIATSDSFPLDATKLFTVLTPTPYPSLEAAEDRLDLPILRKVREVTVDFTNVPTITGRTERGETITFQLQSPPPLMNNPMGLGHVGFLRAIIRRLPELFTTGRNIPAKELVSSLTVIGETVAINSHLWLRPLRAYERLQKLHVTDLSSGDPIALFDALAETAQDAPYVVCPGLYRVDVKKALVRPGTEQLKRIAQVLRKRQQGGCPILDMALSLRVACDCPWSLEQVRDHVCKYLEPQFAHTSTVGLELEVAYRKDNQYTRFTIERERRQALAAQRYQ
ncbi:hypothetical protein C8Q76DRAFT_729061 [Earliella scabrosa]|nr:hypothetical protein C8Q76DRAFT_729061 [Earliella scabrosa]